MKHLFLCLIVCLLFSCKPSPRVLWKFQTGSPVYGSPSIWRDSLIIGSDDHFLYSLDLNTGALRWKRNLGERVFSKPLIQNDVIYVGTGSGNFFALNPADGSQRWIFRAKGTIQYDACGDQDSVYFGGMDRYFYKISKSDGSKAWSFQAGYWLTGHCDFHKNLVFTSSWDQHDYALDRKTGAMVWKLPSGNFNYGGPQVYKDRVYFTTHNSLFVLDAMTGRKLHYQTTGYLKETLVANGYLWTYDDGLSKRNLDGQKIAGIRLGYQSETQPVAGDGFIIVSADKELYGVSDEMKILWKFKADDIFWSPGVIYKNVYYAGNRDSNIYAFRLPR